MRLRRRPRLTRRVIGYRAWSPQGDLLGGPGLWSYGLGHTRWRAGVNEAVCRLGHRHAAPAGRCGCGLYAYHEPPVGYDFMLVGAVAAWGRLQVHSDGFRAQYAQPLVLLDPERPGRWRETVREVAREYGLRLVPHHELEQWARQYGDPVPQELRGPRRRWLWFASGPLHLLGAALNVAVSIPPEPLNALNLAVAAGLLWLIPGLRRRYRELVA